MTRMIRTMIRTRDIRVSGTGIAPVPRVRMPEVRNWCADYAVVRTPSIGKNDPKRPGVGRIPDSCVAFGLGRLPAQEFTDGGEALEMITENLDRREQGHSQEATQHPPEPPAEQYREEDGHWIESQPAAV